MVEFLLLLLLPAGYGGLYILHSVRKRRVRQAIAAAVPLLLLLGLIALLCFEYLSIPQ